MAVRSANRRRSVSQSCSRNSFANVALCFSVVFFLRSGTTREAGGSPICARAIVFTASTAVNRLGFLFFDAMKVPNPECNEERT